MTTPQQQAHIESQQRAEREIEDRYMEVMQRAAADFVAIAKDEMHIRQLGRGYSENAALRHSIDAIKGFTEAIATKANIDLQEDYLTRTRS